MESNNKRKKKDKLDCLNNFLAKLNKKILTSSPNSMKIACGAMGAILDKNKKLILKYSEEGIPDDLPILRAYIWKILLNYLPEDPKLWGDTLSERRAKYNSYKTFTEEKIKKELSEKKYKSKNTLTQIIKDVYRTNSEIKFFFELTDKKSSVSAEEVKKKLENRKTCSFAKIEDIYYNEKECEFHVDVLKRILFIYTIFCPDISYHQGMNELLAPIYYCYSYDQTYTDETQEDIEADSYWSFFNLMTNVSLSFVAAKNKGLETKGYILSNCLKYVDEDIYNSLEKLNIKNEYYSYRWFILLFSQEFKIQDLLKLWDLIFSSEDKYYYVVYIGIAILLKKKDIITKGEMVDAMTGLQNFSDINVDELIKDTKKINSMYKQYLDDFILNLTKLPTNTNDNSQ